MKERRKRKTFTKEFKFEVLSFYYTHGEQRRKTYERFGIDESLLRLWLKTYQIEKKDISLQPELEKALQMSQPQEPETRESMQKKIEALERALEYERMRCRGYETLIEIAEREEGISILKKGGAKQ